MSVVSVSCHCEMFSPFVCLCFEARMDCVSFVGWVEVESITPPLRQCLNAFQTMSANDVVCTRVYLRE